VSDTFPATFTGVTWTCASVGGSCGAASGSGNISTTVTLPAIKSATFTATGTVASSATGSISNTANVTAPAGVTDTAGNNSATATATFTLRSDLSITKNDSTSSLIAVTPDPSTLVVTHTFPTRRSADLVSDTFPATFTGVTWTCASVGGSCGA